MLNFYSHVFTETPSAVFDVWLVGDRFLREIWATLLSTKSQAAMQKKSKPYLFEYYNLQPFYPGVGNMTRSILTRILNKLIEALNENRDHLPKYIIIALDKDLIEEVKFGGFGCKIVFGRTITWLCDNIHQALSTRIDDM